MSTDQQIEAEIQAKGANVAPRITPADLEANIASEHYFTAADGAGRDSVTAMDVGANGLLPIPLHLLTFCVLVLKNGYTITGKSAVASPENFNAEIGRKIARADAVSQMWPLMGYELRSKLAATPADFRDRVRLEKAELDEKLGKLNGFFSTEAFAGLGIGDQDRLRAQAEAMTNYSNVLGERLAAFVG